MKLLRRDHILSRTLVLLVAFLLMNFTTDKLNADNQSADPQTSEFPPSPKKVSKSITANPITTNDIEPGATNIILQSKDGGQTWQDISDGLPANEQPEDFFAGESDLYLHVKNVMYRSKSNLNTPVWEKENVPDLKSMSSRGWPSTSIAFNRSGVMAFNSFDAIYF